MSKYKWKKIKKWTFKFIFWVEEISDFFDKKEELEKTSFSFQIIPVLGGDYTDFSTDWYSRVGA